MANVRHQFKNDKFLFLMISLILLIFVLLLTTDSSSGEIFFDIMLTIVPLSGIYAVSASKTHLKTALFLAVPFVSINIINTFYDHAILFYLNTILAVIFYLYTILVILRIVISSRNVSYDTIFGAVSVYLLIGITFAAIFSVIEVSQPNSFHAAGALSDNDRDIDWTDFIYYSFTTLATVGYGDITPATPIARSLSIVEAIIGVFFVAVLVSKLVSTYVSQSLEKEIKEDIAEIEQTKK